LVNKANIDITFNSNVFKKVFEAFLKQTVAEYLKPTLKYNIMKVQRKRSQLDPFDHDYPHFYTLVYEHNLQPVLQAVRLSEHSSFLIFSKIGEDKNIYGDYYIGCVEPNYWGTIFEICDNGLEEKLFSRLPPFFANKRRRIATITYDTNIMGDVPRNFVFDFYDFLESQDNKLISVKPEYNRERDCYTLNFYGRAKVASARNFHLVMPTDLDSIILMHGKVTKNEFNMDYRHPINIIQAFSISLVSIGKKFFVS